MLEKDLDKLKGLSQDELIQMVLKLRKDNSDLQARVAVLEEMQLLARAARYKPRCEQVETLFDEAEIINAFSVEEKEEDEVVVKEHARKRSPRRCAQASSNAPVYTVDHTKDAPASIVRNGIEYLRTEDRIIDKIASVPAKYVVERNVYAQYEAECAEGKKIVLFSNGEVEALACSPAFASSLAVSKYDDHLPLYRQSEILERNGIGLGRQTMAKWMIAWYSSLTELERYFEKTLYKMNFLNMDETPLRVLDFRTENGRISNSSFMFIRQGSSFDEETGRTRRLVSCSYIQSRSKRTLIDDYAKYGCTSYVMTDGLRSYSGFERHCSCWVHAIRGFKQVLKGHEEANAKEMVLKFDKLYKIEDRYRTKLLGKQIDASTFLKLRKEECTKVIDDIYSFADNLVGKYPSGAMDNAISYIRARKADLLEYLDVVEATPDNNASERIAKAFATGRKNWLFSKTVDGADASCFMYSAIESAKVNGLNPLDYLELLFTFGPGAKTEEEFETLLPWNADLTRLDFIVEARRAAKPDGQRTTPYFFTGLGR